MVGEQRATKTQVKQFFLRTDIATAAMSTHVVMEYTRTAHCGDKSFLPTSYSDTSRYFCCMKLSGRGDHRDRSSRCIVLCQLAHDGMSAGSCYRHALC
jgi:hypothetical protein